MNEQIGNKINDKTYIKLTPFKGWVLENFPFIEADFDAITNYQLLCKVTEYLNNVIYNQNQVQDLGTELVNGYNNLLDYVNNYFANLDVQEEINNKLDEMAQDGSLTNLIKNYIDPLINAQNTEISEFKTEVNANLGTMRNEINALESGSPLVASSTTGMTDITRVYVNTTDGNWYYYDGDSWEIGGVYQSVILGRNSVKDNQLYGNITDDKRTIGENIVNLATTIYENKKLTGYSAETYLPLLADATNYTTMIFNISDLENIGDYFGISLCNDDVTNVVVQYTENTGASLLSRNTIRNDYYYDSDTNIYYLYLNESYTNVAICFNSFDETITPVNKKANYVNDLENIITLNKNNQKTNIKITNILDFATTIYLNKRLTGVNSTTKLPNTAYQPYNNVAIIKISDIPANLRGDIYYHLNNYSTSNQLIISYTENRTGLIATKSSIQNEPTYDSNTKYYKIKPVMFTTQYMAISYYAKDEDYVLYSDLWAEGNPNYNIINANENKTEIILPSTLYGVANKDYMLYYNNVLKYGIANKFQLCSINNSNNYDNFAVINKSSLGSSTLTYKIYKNDTYNGNVTKNFTFINTNANAGDGTTKNVMFIGDSLTDMGKYEQKLKDLFDNDVMSINMVGTRGTAPYKNEGRSGWRAYTYVNCANGSDDLSTLSSTNPFYNTTSETFDFSYYMANNNINDPDYVFICLGTNDLARGNHDTEADIVSYYDTMINSILDYDSNIKVVLWLPPVHGTLNNTNIINTNYNYVFKMKQYLIDNYDNRTAENIYLVPSDLFINTDTDFGTQTENICGETVTSVDDYIHPNNNGFDKIAYPLYYIIKYLSSL